MNRSGMLHNYLKIAYRNLARNKAYTAINIGGLAVGLAVCLLVMLFIRTQWELDRFHENDDRIHRVTTRYHGRLYATAPEPLAPVLRTGYAGIEAATRITRGYTLFLQNEERHTVKGFYADPSFFHVFDGFRLKRGNAEHALSEPHSIVLGQETARRLFPDENPVGKTLLQENGTVFTVTGVLPEPEGSSHLRFEVLYSYSSLNRSEEATPADWSDIRNDHTYLLLADGADPAIIETQVTSLFSKNVTEETASQFDFNVESLSSIRFGPMYWNSVSSHTIVPTWMFYFLGALALVVLLAAAFNYVNLTIARSLRRAREIGVRKTLGAYRGQIIGQFLCEAVMVALAATAMACVLLTALVPLFNQLYVFFTLLEMPPLSFQPFREPWLLLLILGIGTTVGLLAGAYPAFVLSSFQPSRTLKSRTVRKGRFRSFSLRKGLITAQLGFALLVILTAATMYRQVRHMVETDYGIRTQNLISVELEDVPYEDFRRAAPQIPGVEGITVTNNLPQGTSSWDSEDVRVAPGAPAVSMYYYAVDTSFVREMEVVPLALLRDWKAAFSSGQSVLLNEAAVRALGFARPAEALGETVVSDMGTLAVAGVVENYYLGGVGELYGGSGADPLATPMVLHVAPERYRYALVLAAPGDVTDVAHRLEDVWDRFDTIFPLEYRYYDDVLQMMYAPLVDASFLTGAVALLAVLIACLGLLSLTAQSVETRRKEIGIRKVLGAETAEIVRLLSKSFAVLVALAAAVALPLAWLLNSWWLQFFSYQVDVGVVVFVLCTGVLLLLVLAVVGSQTVRAALADPVEALRSE